MNSSRENPESPENRRATRENEAHVRMLQATAPCPECGGIMLRTQDVCDDCKNACPMCGDQIDEDTGVCFTCKETVR
jgi:hypothetical protein